MHRRLALLGLFVTAITTSACSSTAQQGAMPNPAASEIKAIEAPSSLETFDPQQATEGATSGDAASMTSVPSASGETASAAESAFVAAAPPTPAAASAGARKAATFGPGVTDHVIRLGIPYLPPKETYYDIYPELKRPDFKRVWNVVIDAINSTGGVLGRQIEPVFLGPDPTTEETCTYFTEDQEVIAVAGYGMETGPCLDAAGIVSITHSYVVSPDYYRDAPHSLVPLGISQTRAAELYINGLMQQGFFDGHPTIGLIRWDTPEVEDAAVNVVEPMLARHGLEIATEVVLSWPDQKYETEATAMAQGRAGVRTFKDAGVDRVLTLDVGSYILPEFTDYAQDQDYHPRYGVDSLNGGEWDTNRSQLKGAVGVGWMPWVDLEPEDAYRYGSEGGRRCKDLLDAAGEGAQMDTYNEAVWSSSICDAALLLKASVEAGGPSITNNSVVAGAESLRESFQGANTLLTRFGPGRHEGIAAIRFVKWFTGCQCFRYTSELFDAG